MMIFLKSISGDWHNQLAQCLRMGRRAEFRSPASMEELRAVCPSIIPVLQREDSLKLIGQLAQLNLSSRCSKTPWPKREVG